MRKRNPRNPESGMALVVLLALMIVFAIGMGMIYTSFSGGGSGQINGSVFTANTNSRTAPYAQFATLGSLKCHGTTAARTRFNTRTAGSIGRTICTTWRFRRAS